MILRCEDKLTVIRGEGGGGGETKQKYKDLMVVGDTEGEGMGRTRHHRLALLLGGLAAHGCPWLLEPLERSA